MKRALVLVGVGVGLGTALSLSPLVHGRSPRIDADVTPPAATSQDVASTPVETPTDVAIASPEPHPSSYDPMRSFAPLFDAVSPAVLAIEIEGKSEPSAELQQIPPEFRRFFDPRGFEAVPTHGEGSGFVISADGLVLTNNHVVENATRITARFADGRTAPATVLGTDEHLDIALLRLDSPGPWPFVALGDSTEARVGDWVVAVGNPLGLGTTVTAGIISGKGRALGHDVYDDFLQTDAAINPGNSGGPLFSLDGKVIGINTAIINGANTVGFSIPINLVQGVVDDLETKGHVARGFIGVRPVAGPDGTGAVIAQIYDDTPAKKAGLQAGDLITRIDDVAVKDPGQLVRAIGTHNPGEQVVLEVVRGDKTLSMPVELAERPGDDAMPQDGAVPKLGLALGALSDPAAKELGLQYGVPVNDVTKGSPADGRVRKGDIILSVNQWPVATAEQVVELVDRSRSNVLLEILRDGRNVVVNVALN